MIDVVVDQGPLRLGDRAFDGVELLGDLWASPWTLTAERKRGAVGGHRGSQSPRELGIKPCGGSELTGTLASAS